MKMGPVIFDKIQFFFLQAWTSRDPDFERKQGSVHFSNGLLKTKYKELILLDSRSTSSFLSAMNIVFSLYGTPSLLLSDKEGAMIKLYNNIQNKTWSSVSNST